MIAVRLWNIFRRSPPVQTDAVTRQDLSMEMARIIQGNVRITARSWVTLDSAVCSAELILDLIERKDAYPYIPDEE